MTLLICGGTVVDLIFPRVPHLPRWPAHTEFTTENLVLLPTPPLVSIGGNGANAAYVAARCGATTHLHSNLGTDAFGQLARHWLRDGGCILADTAPTPTPTRTAVNVTAANDEQQRATLFYPGEAPPLAPPSAGVSHLLVCGWPHPAPADLAENLQAWQARGTRTAVDFGPLLDQVPSLSGLRPVLAALDLFLANEHELLTIAGCRDLPAALDRLREHFDGDVIIKRGPDGVAWAPAGTADCRYRRGQSIDVVNTVGAGDTFNGTLLAGLVRGASCEIALRLADEAACSVVRSPLGVLGLEPPAWFPRN